MKKMIILLTILGLALPACSKDSTPVKMCSGSGNNLDQGDFQISLYYFKDMANKLFGSYTIETNTTKAPDSIESVGMKGDYLCDDGFPIDVMTGKGSLIKVKITEDIGGCRKGSEVLFTPVYNKDGLDSIKATGAPECTPRLFKTDAEIRKNTTVSPQRATAPQILIVGQWNPDEASEPFSLVVKGNGTYQIITETEITEGRWKKNDDGTYTLVDAMGILGDYVKLEMKDGKPTMTSIYQGQVSSTYTKVDN